MFFNLLMAKAKKKQQEYIELEYLESTGTQYFNLDYIPTENTGLHVKASTVGQGDMIICGSRNNVTTGTRLYLSSTYSSANQTVPLISIGRGLYIYLQLDGSLIALNSTLTVPFNTVYEQYTNYKNSKVVRFVDDTRDITSVTIPELTFTPNQPLYLFAGNIAGVANYSYKGKIYSCEITEGDKLVMDLIPVLDKDLEPCMYDKVSGKYFYNQGSGEFKWKLPNQLEYIQTTNGSYTIIDVITDGSYTIEAKCRAVSIPDTTVRCFGGYMWQGDSPINNNPRSGIGCYNAHWHTGYNKTGQAGTCDTNLHVFKLVEFLKFGENFNADYFSVDGEQLDISHSSNVDFYSNTRRNWAIGGRIQSLGFKNPLDAEHYYWKFWDGNDKLVAYIIPVFDENLTPCFYDLVSKKYFYNIGTGQFKGYFEDGSQVVSYLSATGTQWIDTEIIPLMGDEIELKNVKCVKKSSGMQAVFSAGTGNYQTILLVADGGYPTRGAFYKYFATGGAQNVNEPYFLNDLTTIKIESDGSIYYNGTFIIQSPAEKETDSSLRLFYRANNSQPMTGQIGAVSIKRDGKFIIDLIPVIKSDNTACMFNLMSKTYLSNKGTGSFTYSTQANLFDPTKPSYVAGYISTNNNITSSTLTDSFYIPCKPNTTYLVKRTSYKETDQVWRVATTPEVPKVNMSIPHHVGGLINDLYLVIKSRDVDKYLLFSEGKTLHTSDLSKFTVLEIEDNNSLIA